MKTPQKEQIVVDQEVVSKKIEEMLSILEKRKKIISVYQTNYSKQSDMEPEATRPGKAIFSSK